MGLIVKPNNRESQLFGFKNTNISLLYFYVSQNCETPLNKTVFALAYFHGLSIFNLKKLN